MENLMLRSHYAAVDPLREPSWRYERVLSITPSTGRLRSLSINDDEYVRRLRPFCVAYHRGDEQKTLKLASKDPVTFLAWNIHLHRDKFVRSCIDARLLAREDDVSIAEKVGTIPDVIDAYEKLFFNVRDRLDSKDWIAAQVHCVSANSVFEGLEDPLSNRDRSFRFFGYYAGSLVLDTVISGWNSGIHLPTDPSEVEDFFDDYLISSIRRRSAQAAGVFEINKYNVLQLLELFCRVKEIVSKTDGDSSDQLRDVQKRATLGALREATYTFGATEIREKLLKAGLGELHNYSAEPRDEELVSCYANGNAENVFDAEVRKLKIQEAAKAEEDEDEETDE